MVPPGASRVVCTHFQTNGSHCTSPFPLPSAQGTLHPSHLLGVPSPQLSTWGTLRLLWVLFTPGLTFVIHYITPQEETWWPCLSLVSSCVSLPLVLPSPTLIFGPVWSSSQPNLTNLGPNLRSGSTWAPNLRPNHWFWFFQVQFQFGLPRTKNQTLYNQGFCFSAYTQIVLRECRG